MRPIDPAQAVQVRTPVKAHLADGSTVVYPGGVSVANGKLLGAGTRYDLTLKPVGEVGELALTDVVALETFEETTDKALTTLASSGTTLGIVFGAAALAVAIFGSCPTVYADVDGDHKLEAELFSYSIAPLFEMTDVDRLRATPSADGRLELEVRNEAMETHYLNQMEVLEVRHDAGEMVVPDDNGQLVALSGLQAPTKMIDRRGRDLHAVLDARDDRFFQTDGVTLQGVTKSDLRDAIELELPVGAGQREVALLLTLRNSLLNTILFYDMMLKGAGARSLDWLGRDLGQLRPAYSLGSWYATQMGMRIEVWKNGAYTEAGHIGDSGPIAWKDMAIVLPVASDGGVMRVRLSFPADNWRIDQIGFTTGVRRPSTRTLQVSNVVSSGSAHDTSAAASLAAADARYLQTTPGQSFRVSFDAGPAPAGTSRTFLLKSRGYYTEWIRGSWLGSEKTAAFTPGDDALLVALKRWRDVQPDFERRFYATRIPVR